MSNYVLFQMTEPLRQSLINQHLFYVEQAKARLLVQFSELEPTESAESFISGWMEENKHHFDPSFHEPGDSYAEACERYHALLELGNQTRLSVVAGMYHEWEKQLRQWLTDEVCRWHDGSNALKAIWTLNFSQVVELLKSAQWDISGQNYYRQLDLCRLIVNVYKHGNGQSANDLLSTSPEYLFNPYNTTQLTPDDALFDSYFPIHSSLKVSDQQLLRFSSAIVSFWQSVPKESFDLDVDMLPAKLKKAITEDAEVSSTKPGGKYD